MESPYPENPISEYSTLVLGGAVCLALYFLLTKKTSYTGTLPPGPKPVPFFGNLLDVKRSDCNGPGIFDKWADEFGAIYSVRFGSYDGVVLNTADIIREVLVKKGLDSSARSNNVFFFRIVVGNYGIAQNEGQNWKETRRTVLRSLRDFGMGKKSLETRIQEEASALVSVFDQYGGKPFDPSLVLHNATSNIICSIVFGERYNYNDAEFSLVSEGLQAIFRGIGLQNPGVFIPILTPLVPIVNPTFLKATRSIYLIRSYIRNKIKQHSEKFDPNDIRSFIDIYLKAERDGELTNKAIENNMLATILDLFSAGSETSSTSLHWTLLYLVNYPEVQAKCQLEIAKEIGQVKVPTTSDRDQLLYTQATVYEIQRISSIVAYGVLHRATSDIEVAGYMIPKGYLIMTNLHHVHMDPEYWGDPKVFRPERWLGEDGKLIKHESFMPFATGPRECPGKNLALQELFIMLVSLLQKFTFKAVDPKDPPAIKGRMGVTHVPYEYQLIASRY